MKTENKKELREARQYQIVVKIRNERPICQCVKKR